MSRKNIADVLAEEAEHAEQHKHDELPPGYRRAQSPKEPAQVYSLRIPADRLDQLRRLAADRRTTPSALMRAWVLDRLDVEASMAGRDPREIGELFRFSYAVSLAMGSGEISDAMRSGGPEAVLALLDEKVRQVVRDELDRAGVR